MINILNKIKRGLKNKISERLHITLINANTKYLLRCNIK